MVVETEKEDEAKETVLDVQMMEDCNRQGMMLRRLLKERGMNSFWMLQQIHQKLTQHCKLGQRRNIQTCCRPGKTRKVYKI